MIGSERYSLLHRCPVVGPISFTEETAEACVAAWNHLPVEDALVKALKSVRLHLTEYWHREMRGIECDIDVQKAQNVIKAALKLAEEDEMADLKHAKDLQPSYDLHCHTTAQRNGLTISQ